jgi:GNAT superfamily N-acetyltransferase
VAPDAVGGANAPVFVARNRDARAAQLSLGETEITSMMEWLPRQWRRAPEMLQWRGVAVASLLVLREIFRPVMYWYVWQIFERDLREPLPKAYAQGELRVTVYTAAEPTDKPAEEIYAMKVLPLAEIYQRFARGDAAAIVYDGEKAAGYMWLTFASGKEIAFDTAWVLGADECLKCDSFVLRPWRGKGIHSLLNAAMNQFAKDRGMERVFGSISALNTQSMSLTKKSGSGKVMTLVLLRIRWVRWTWRKAYGAPLESRFIVNEN